MGRLLTSSHPDPTPLSEYEIQREKNISENRKVLKDLMRSKSPTLKVRCLSTTRRIQIITYLAIMQIGMLIAVNTPKYCERPQIGRIISISPQEVVLEWLVGTYSGTWREWKGKEGGKTVVFTDTVATTNIIHTDIQLTSSKRLSPSVVKVLKTL